MATSASSNKKILDRIEAVRQDVTDPFDGRKLDYVAQQLTPAGLRLRGEDDQDLTHLHEVAEQIIKPVEKRGSNAA